eukprot:snap_masked-scaffold_4-processed-gene-5.37-mRNA-1 protein AED:1.00 eAED:1.00 QI:0/-1/0/0/-1/1/1/0/173
MFVTIILLLLAGFTYLSPKQPDFSVCVSELEWESLLSTFLDFQYTIQGIYLLQASLYNPNKLSLALTNISGQFLYKNISIADYKLRDGAVVAPRGSVVDIVLETELNVPVKQALEMYESYFYQKKLLLDVTTDVNGEIYILGNSGINLNLSLPRTQISLMELDDRRCKCKLKK